MKKTLFSLMIIMYSSLFSQQDGIIITLEGQTDDLSGKTHTMVAPSFQTFDVPFHVENQTGETHLWVITRIKIDVPTGWKDGMCWGHGTDASGGTCFTSGQMAADSWTTPQSSLFYVANTEFGKLKPQINPDDFVSGMAHYRYYIAESGGHSYSDSVDLLIDFTAAIKPLKDELTVSIVPNPASDYINISVNGIENASLKIVDMVGNVVYKDVISNSKIIQTANFKTGVYFVTVDAPGSKSLSRKIIIKH